MIYYLNGIFSLPFPFVTTKGVKQKARPNLIILETNYIICQTKLKEK